MILSTGKVAIPVKFDTGDEEQIFINPNDKEIFSRAKAFEKRLNDKIDKIDVERHKEALTRNVSNVNLTDIDAVMALSDEELDALSVRAEALMQIENEFNVAIREEINVVFASDVATALFKHCQPLDTVVVEKDGKEVAVLYVLHALEWLLTECSKVVDSNSAAIKKHIDKYRK